MRILSIDQSLTNNAMVYWVDGVMVDFDVIQTSNVDEDHVRIMKIGEEVEKLLDKYKIDLLVIEGLSFGSISTSVRKLSGLYYHLLIKAELHQIPWQEIPPTQVKKFATGSGKAKKKDMWEALPQDIQEAFLSRFKTIKSGRQDLADAYWIGMKCLNNLEQGKQC